MAKPKMFGLNRTYIPNSKADIRYRKKVYQRNREKPIAKGTNVSGRIKEEESQ